ncbi:hypothetical protein diail_6754 [Diaporthe ilicicola]|nr:hypothetical protein diail_6754 [Diaporthe ilicicola]
MAAAASSSAAAARQTARVFSPPSQHLGPSSADFLSPLLWADNTAGDTTYAAQDPLSFGQPWEPSGDIFSSAAVPPLDLDLNFDPALIDALPDSTNIPDFFIDVAHTVNNNASIHPHMLTPPQPLRPITTTTTTAPTAAAAATAVAATAAAVASSGSKSPASSSSDGSPRAAGTSGAGRQPARSQEDPDVVLKRQRNTIAARKYRQKRLDRIQELEDALESVTGERDDLKLRLARQEAETAALKEMMRMNSGDRDRN